MLGPHAQGLPADEGLTQLTDGSLPERCPEPAPRGRRRGRPAASATLVC